MMRDSEIVVTEFDESRLRNLLEGVRRWNARDRTHVNPLESELDRAQVVPPADERSEGGYIQILDWR